MPTSSCWVLAYVSASEMGSCGKGGDSAWCCSVLSELLCCAVDLLPLEFMPPPPPARAGAREDDVAVEDVVLVLPPAAPALLYLRPCVRAAVREVDVVMPGYAPPSAMVESMEVGWEEPVERSVVSSSD